MNTQLALAYIVEFHERWSAPVNKVLVKNLDHFGAEAEWIRNTFKRKYWYLSLMD